MSKIILKFNNTNVGLKKLYLFEKNTYGDFDQGFGKRRDFYFPNRYFDLVCLHARSYSTNSFKRQLFLYFKKFAKKRYLLARYVRPFRGHQTLKDYRNTVMRAFIFLPVIIVVIIAVEIDLYFRTSKSRKVLIYRISFVYLLIYNLYIYTSIR